MLSAVAAAVLAALVMAPMARADFATLYGGDLSCSAQAANGDVRLCSGETATWDGKTRSTSTSSCRRRRAALTGPTR